MSHRQPPRKAAANIRELPNPWQNYRKRDPHPQRAHKTRRRGCASYALAFSTLLSSQGADAHHRHSFRSSPGQPSDSTGSTPRCQLSSPELCRSLVSSRPPAYRNPPDGRAAHRRTRLTQVAWTPGGFPGSGVRSRHPVRRLVSSIGPRSLSALPGLRLALRRSVSPRGM